MTELAGHRPVQYCPSRIAVLYSTCNFLYAEAFRLVPGPHDAVGREQPREGHRRRSWARICRRRCHQKFVGRLGPHALTGVAGARSRTCHSTYNTFRARAQTDEMRCCSNRGPVPRRARSHGGRDSGVGPTGQLSAISAEAQRQRWNLAIEGAVYMVIFYSIQALRSTGKNLSGRNLKRLNNGGAGSKQGSKKG